MKKIVFIWGLVLCMGSNLYSYDWEYVPPVYSGDTDSRNGEALAKNFNGARIVDELNHFNTDYFMNVLNLIGGYATDEYEFIKQHMIYTDPSTGNYYPYYWDMISLRNSDILNLLAEPVLNYLLKKRDTGEYVLSDKDYEDIKLHTPNGEFLINKLLVDLRNKTAQEKKKEIARLSKEFMVKALKTAKYLSVKNGAYPLNLQLNHSNKLGLTVISWDDDSVFKVEKTYGASVKANATPNGYYNNDIDYKLKYGENSFRFIPEYSIYRIVNGNKKLIGKYSSYDRKLDNKSVSIDGLNFDAFTSIVSYGLDAEFDRKDNERAKISFIDYESEKYLKKGLKVSYEVKSFNPARGGHKQYIFWGDRVNRIMKPVTHVSKVDFDGNADGYIDFAPTRLGWLPAITYLILF